MLLRTAWRAEINRKLFHLCTAVIPLGCLLLPRTAVLWILGAAVAFALATELARHANSRVQALLRAKIGFMVRHSEWQRLFGSTYLLIGALLSVWLFTRDIAVAVLLVLSVSDTFASLIGLRYGRSQFLGKSLAGSSAFFVTAFLVLWGCASRDSAAVAYVAALVATFAEALPTLRLGRLELNDNLTVPLLTGAVLSALGPHL